MNSCSCIIPIYNEGSAVLAVLRTLLQVPEIAEIICVDDGSTDNGAALIEKYFPLVVLIRLTENEGKAAAVARGLALATQDVVLLMDADLSRLKAAEISHAIRRFVGHPSIDLLILENKGGNLGLDRYLNKHIVLSGQRILRKADLEQIIARRQPRGYELEVAINDYMIGMRKRVFYMKTSSYNPHKIQKLGWLEGLKRDIRMDSEIIRFIGLRHYLRQLLTFRNNELR